MDRAKGTDRRKHTHLLKETPLQHLSMICPELPGNLDSKKTSVLSQITSYYKHRVPVELALSN